MNGDLWDQSCLREPPQELLTVVLLLQEYSLPEGTMGNISSIPKASPLGIILSHWNKFSLDFFLLLLQILKMISVSDNINCL